MDEKEYLEQVYPITQQIGNSLQDLENFLSQNNFDFPQIKIPFPLGILGKVEDFMNELSFLSDKILKRNLAYHLLLADFYKWFLDRFNILFTGQEMLIKEAIGLYGRICAAIVANISGRKGFMPGVKDISKNRIIDDRLKEDLEWLWNTRCKEHIENLKEVEYEKYSLENFEKAILIWERLKQFLQKSTQNKKGLIHGQ